MIFFEFSCAKNDKCQSKLHCTYSIYVILEQYTLSFSYICNCTLKYTCFLPGWSGAEIECTLHVTLPKKPINRYVDLVISK